MLRIDTTLGNGLEKCWIQLLPFTAIQRLEKGLTDAEKSAGKKTKTNGCSCNRGGHRAASNTMFLNDQIINEGLAKSQNELPL